MSLFIRWTTKSFAGYRNFTLLFQLANEFALISVGFLSLVDSSDDLIELVLFEVGKPISDSLTYSRIAWDAMLSTL